MKEGNEQMSQVRPYGHSVIVEGTPIAGLSARLAGELAGGRIKAACPHAADHMSLPGPILGCDDCVRALTEAADALRPPECSCCGNRGATRTTCFVSGGVFVAARVCEACGTAGNAPVSPN